MESGPLHMGMELLFLNCWRAVAMVLLLVAAYALVRRHLLSLEREQESSSALPMASSDAGRLLALFLLIPMLLSLSGCGYWYNGLHSSGNNSGDGGGGGGTGGGGGGGGGGSNGSITGPLTVTPASLTWVKEPVGQTSGAKQITIANPNTGAVTMGDITSDVNFPITGNTCPLSGSTLAPAATCTLSISFRPRQQTSLTGTVSIASNASTDPQSVSLSGLGVAGPLLFTPAELAFPTTAVGQSSPQQTVTLSNTTASDVTMTALTHTNVFPETNDCTPTLPAGGSCTFTVNFVPLCSGDKTGTITAHAGSSTVQLYLSGTATGTSTCPGPQPPSGNTALSIAPGRLLFGDQAIGTTATLQLVATNFQNVDINIANISVPAPFTEVNNCPATLPPGFSCRINVSFSPTVKGYFSELLSITDSGAAVPQTIPVIGNAVPPGTQAIVDRNDN